jgi:thioredoxin-related protein
MKHSIFLGICLLVMNLAGAQTWQTDLEEAKITAHNENKDILLVFQGSDWCAPCIKLDREIWTSSEFKNYAKEHYVMLKADFPRKAKNQLEPAQQKKNNALAEKYNKEGYFPLVILLDEKGNVLGKTGYKKVSPKEYIQLLNSFKS